MIAPESPFYRELALECIAKCITVDLFLAVTLKYKSLDVATMAPITGITGGDLYVYADFDVVLEDDLNTLEIGFDSFLYTYVY